VIPAALHTRDTGITRQALYGDVYGKLNQLNRLTRANGDGPILYSGMRPPPPGWFFTNTKSAFARPLRASFGRDLVGTAFRRNTVDRIYTLRSARIALAGSGHRTGYLVRLRPGFTERYPSEPKARYVGTVDWKVPVLRRSLDPWSERFSTLDLRLDVYALRA
jgi:hypothetical protein